MNQAVPRRWLGGVFALALCLRLGYVALGYPVPPQDTPDYDEIALNLVAGEGFVASTVWHGNELRSWRAPFYPFFLAGVYAICGYGHGPVKIAQAVVGAATAVLVLLLAWRFRPETGPLAGVLAAVYGPLVASANEVMTETFFVFFVVLAAWLLVGTEGRRRWLLGGVAIGLAGLTRPVGLLWVPALALASLGPGRSWRWLVWVVLGAVLTLSPWTLRNSLLHGTLVPVTTHGGFIVARSNAADPAWRHADGWGIQPEVFERWPSEVERDRRWMAQGLDYIASHPGHYLALAGERFLRFWYFFTPGYNIWFVALLPLAAVGIWRYGRAEGYVALSCFIGVSLAVFCFLLYGSARFRLPFEPFFLLFAAAAYRDAERRWGRARALAAVGAWVGTNLLVYANDEALRAWVLARLRAFGLK